MTSPALKDIGRISSLLGVSPLSRSAIWHQPVDTIEPAQLFAFIGRFDEIGQRDLAETAVSIAQSEVQKAIARNEIGISPMLSYSRPTRTYLTFGELKNGLSYVGQPRASAILFALETGLDSVGVSMLTHRRLALMQDLSDLAKNCLDACPRHLRTPYVFWEDRDNIPLPLFGLDAAIFDALGLVWAELAFGYEHLIMTDTEVDRGSLDRFLSR
jgi:hypothetical protein